MQKKIPEQSPERAEPAKGPAQKNNPGDVTQKQIAQPAAPGILSGKPNRGNERGESDPAQPRLIERRETTGAKQSARDRGQPRPEPQRFSPAIHVELTQRADGDGASYLHGAGRG